MGATRWAVLWAALLSAGCAREPAGPTWDFDEEADAAEARAFTARWDALSLQNDPASVLARSALALEALEHGLAYKVPGLRRETLAAQGLQDAQRSVAAFPGDPRPQRLVAGYLLKQQDFAGAAKAACAAADLAPRSANDQESCGDLLKETGDAQGAVQRYKAAVMASADRRQQLELIRRIDLTSLTPAADLEALPREIVDQYRARHGPHPRQP